MSTRANKSVNTKGKQAAQSRQRKNRPQQSQHSLPLDPALSSGNGKIMGPSNKRYGLARGASTSSNSFPVQARRANFGKYEQLVRQIISPSACDDSIMPSPIPGTSAQVVPRRYSRVIDYSPGLADKFTVLMSPDLYTPGFITNKDPIVIPAAAPGEMDISLDQQFTSVFPSPKLIIGAGECFDTLGDKAKVILQQIADTVGTNVQGLPITSAIGDTKFAIHNNSGTHTISFHIWFLNTATGLWVDLGLNQILAGEDFTYTLSTPYSALGFSGSATPAAGVAIDIKIHVGTGQLTVLGGTGFAPAFSHAIDLLDIREGRVLGMSVKITNTSNALSQGGNMSIARVPSSFPLLTENLSIAMSSLPANRKYQDCATTGGFAFWLPEQEDEWSFDSLAAKRLIYQDANYLVAHVSGLPPGCSFRITFGWTVEFYTSSQSYPKMSTPDWNDEWAHIVRLLTHMDAACCNPQSASIFQRFLDSGKQYLGSAKNHYDSNKETYQMLLQLARSIGLMPF